MLRPGKMFPYIFGMLFRKPATVPYPFVKVEKPKNFRGRLKFDGNKCIGCGICTRVCPAGAITIEKIGDKRFKAVVQIDRCIFCGQCVDSCLKEALKCTGEFELAGLNKDDMKVEI